MCVTSYTFHYLLEGTWNNLFVLYYLPLIFYFVVFMVFLNMMVVIYSEDEAGESRVTASLVLFSKSAASMMYQ